MSLKHPARPAVASGDMDGLLACGSCGEDLDLRRRRPKLLPCGHTLCCGCVRDNHNKWGGPDTGAWTVCCPADRQSFFAGPDPGLLPDDLQLVCWLEATSQGVLECVCCGRAFDALLRRPAALDCGHAMCRVCVQEAADARARAQLRALMPPPALPLSVTLAAGRPLTRRPSRRDSVDESWDYSQEDGDTCTSSSLSSLPSDDDGCTAVGADLTVDCPVEGCATGVRVRDHYHLLSCLDDSALRRRRVKKTPRRRESLRADDDLHAELLEKLSLLEKHVSAVGEHAAAAQQQQTVSAVLNVTTSGTTSLSGERHVDEHELHAVLEALRRVVEHKDSPPREQPAVLQRSAVSHPALPDLLQSERGVAAARSRDDVSAVETLKEVKIALDVWELSLHPPGEMRVKKEALLRSDSEIWKLTGVDCWSDPEWTERLLRRAAPHVEQLQLRYPGREHLRVVREAMPHLRRLELRGWRGQELLEQPFSFDETPARNRHTLEWLEVFMPEPTALSLLRAHRRSLRKVRFIVADEWGPTTTTTTASGTAPTSDQDEGLGSDAEEDGYCVVPYAEDALRSHCWDGLLHELGPRPRPLPSDGDPRDSALSSLTLLWPSARPHDSWHCRRFCRVLRSARPHLVVDCEVCRQHQRRDNFIQT